MPTLYARNAALLRTEARSKGLPCSRCGLEIDWTAPSRSRWAFSAGHITAKSLGGSDHLDNLRTEHYGCNAAAGNGVTRGLGSGNGTSAKNPSARTRPTAHHRPASERWP